MSLFAKAGHVLPRWCTATMYLGRLVCPLAGYASVTASPVIPKQHVVIKSPLRKVYLVDSQGEITETGFDKTTAARMRLQSRDLRLLEFYNQQPAILARRSAIVVNLLDIRAIIRHDSMLLFESHHYSSPLTSTIKNKATHKLSNRDRDADLYDPYEFRALEVILDVVCTSLWTDVQTLKPQTDALLRELEALFDVRTKSRFHDQHTLLANLLEKSKRLTKFQQKVAGVNRALMDVLESDEDMAHMYLSTKADTGHPRRVDQHEEVEMLLEAYLRQVEEVGQLCDELESNIQHTEDVTNIRLDSKRNEMMRLELILAMGTFSISMSALLAALFGMNLNSGWEEHPQFFYLVSGSAMFGSAALWKYLMRLI